jgi:hypothetical protein
MSGFYVILERASLPVRCVLVHLVVSKMMIRTYCTYGEAFKGRHARSNTPSSPKSFSRLAGERGVPRKGSHVCGTGSIFQAPIAVFVGRNSHSDT